MAVLRVLSICAAALATVSPLWAQVPPQTIFTVGSTFGTNNGRHTLLTGVSGSGSQEIAVPVPVSGIVRNWRFRQLTAPGVGASWTWRIQKNGVDTALAITISGTDTEGLDTDSVSFAAGDTIRITSTRGGSPLPVASAWQSALEFVADVPGVSIYGFGADSISSTSAEVDAALYGTGFSTSTALQYSIVSAAGSVTSWRVAVNGAPGTGKSRVFTLVKNGVAQDGSSGTPDTRLTIADSATSGSAAFDLAVSPSDQLQVRQTPVNTPSGGTSCVGELAFSPTHLGDWMISTENAVGLITSGAATYHWPVGGEQNGSETEGVREVTTSLSSFTVKGFNARLANPPGTGKSWTLRLRKNGADTPLTVVLADSEIEGNTSGFVPVAPGDRLSFTAFASGTPGSITARAWMSLLVDSTSSLPPPVITAVTPSTGSAGQAITIIGTSFGPLASSGTVTINGQAVVITSWSDTAIGVLLPGSVTSGQLVVTVNGVAATGPTFTAATPSAAAVQYAYDEAGRLVGVVAPNGEAAGYRYDAVGNLTAITRTTGTQVSVLEFTPNEGGPGTIVTIHGTGFSTTSAQNTVLFNGIAAAIQESTPNRLTVTVPAGATSGTISVSTPSGQTTTADTFTVTTDDPPGSPESLAGRIQAPTPNTRGVSAEFSAAQPVASIQEGGHR